METFERLASGVELRREGRRIVGPAMVYGDRSPTHRERFEVGAFREDLADKRTRWLDIEHRVREVIAWSPDGGMALTENGRGLHVDALIPAIPAGDRALADIALRRLGGLSVEFKPLAESRDADGTRVIAKARLNGVGVVRSPSYPSSSVEVRGRSGRSMRSSVSHPASGLGCRCSGNNCKTASFSTARPWMLRWTKAFNKPGIDPWSVCTRTTPSRLPAWARVLLRREGAAGVIVIDLPDDAAGQLP